MAGAGASQRGIGVGEFTHFVFWDRTSLNPVVVVWKHGAGFARVWAVGSWRRPTAQSRAEGMAAAEACVPDNCQRIRGEFPGPQSDVISPWRETIDLEEYDG